jgi:hypothetical protein
MPIPCGAAAWVGSLHPRHRVRAQQFDHGVVSREGLSIRAVPWDFVGVKRQITIRRLLAIFVIAGLVLAPLSRPVMAGMVSDASMPAMAEGLSTFAPADAMAGDVMAGDVMASDVMASDVMASDMPCCPTKAPAPLDCDKCMFMAGCATQCFSGISAAVFHPLLAISARIIPLRNDSWPDSVGYPPPDHPPRTLI